jgi:type VI protein secretion system component VasK
MTLETFLTENLWIIIIVLAAILLGLYFLWRTGKKKSHKRDRVDSIAQEIQQAQLRLNEINSMLGNLYYYFHQVEQKLSMNYIREVKSSPKQPL